MRLSLYWTAAFGLVSTSSLHAFSIKGFYVISQCVYAESGATAKTLALPLFKEAHEGRQDVMRQLVPTEEPIYVEFRDSRRLKLKYKAFKEDLPELTDEVESEFQSDYGPQHNRFLQIKDREVYTRFWIKKPVEKGDELYDIAYEGELRVKALEDGRLIMGSKFSRVNRNPFYLELNWAQICTLEPMEPKED